LPLLEFAVTVRISFEGYHRLYTYDLPTIDRSIRDTISRHLPFEIAGTGAVYGPWLLWAPCDANASLGIYCIPGCTFVETAKEIRAEKHLEVISRPFHIAHHIERSTSRCVESRSGLAFIPLEMGPRFG
jgi:hypothetical protein